MAMWGTVSEAHLEQVQELIVELDYGQFYLCTETRWFDVVEQVVEKAITADGIAQERGLVVVLVPHQNNFEMPLRVERWTAEPSDDLDAWQEAFVASVQVGELGLWYDSATIGATSIEAPVGRYAVRISGRGFVNRGWPGSTRPGDVWRIQLWPSEMAIDPFRIRTWAGPPS